MRLTNHGDTREQCRLVSAIQRIKIDQLDAYEKLRAALTRELQLINRHLRELEGPELHRAQGRAVFLDDLCDLLDQSEHKHAQLREKLERERNTSS
ncbi:MAG: hypothetical protein CME59_22615 [Halioglobus sp.]|nr:hypothetical protein [Halioglobus sp.]|tara:strand:+ start:3538 stop:3825 length:288 start_codon:yes stop_codon:yes gene_type:complete